MSFQLWVEYALELRNQLDFLDLSVALDSEVNGVFEHRKYLILKYFSIINFLLGNLFFFVDYLGILKIFLF